MEIIRGKETSFMTWAQLARESDCYEAIHIDIGTGDGRFVQQMAEANSSRFVIGLDACRENLVKVSRNAPKNALFVIANAQRMPQELAKSASSISVNFPWGSLLAGLLHPDSQVMQGLALLMAETASIEIRLNAGALAEAGYSLEDGTEQVWTSMTLSGLRLGNPKPISATELSACPTTWAKRLAFGRDARAMVLKAKKSE